MKRSAEASRARHVAGSSRAPDDGLHLSWISACGMVAIAVLRAVVSFSSDPSFGTDPFLDPTPPVGLGPAGSMALDMLLILFAAVGFMGEGRSGRQIDWLLVALAFAPAAVIAWHGTNHFEHLWRGCSWLAAIIAAAASAHLARDRAIRVLMAAGLMAIIVPLCVRGLVQVYIEHPEMVEVYERDRAAILAARGIEPGSSSALVFEHRLEQPEATAWFGLANVFGSFLVAGLIIFAGWSVATIRGRLESGFAGVMAIAALLAGSGLMLAGSKGAFAGAAAGIVLLVLALTPVAWSRVRLGGAIAIAIVLLAIVAVVIRGAILPEDFAGDRSILFRWHYWQGAGRMIAEEPIVGVGPAGFQDAFVRHRLPITPEEAASAHNVFIDWVATLGVSGFCWIALSGVLLWRAGNWFRFERGDIDAQWTEREAAVTTSIALIALGAFVPALLLERPVLDARAVFFRALGIMGYLGLAALAAKALRRTDQRLVWASVAAGAIALFVHAQIEVTLTQPSAAAWAFILLGVAGARRPHSVQDATGAPALWFGRLVLLALLAFGMFVFVPVVGQAWTITHAAKRLREVGMVRLTLEDVASTRDVDQRERALRGLRSAAVEAEMRPEILTAIDQAADGTPTSIARLAELLQPEIARKLDIERSVAAQELWNAFELLKSNPRPLRQSLEQVLLGGMFQRALPNETYANVKASVDHLMEIDRSPDAVALAARLHEHFANADGDIRHVEEAIAFRRRLVELDPHGLAPRVALADLLAKFGRIEEAREEYRRALDQSMRWYLDDLRQLTDEERERIEAWFDENS